MTFKKLPSPLAYSSLAIFVSVCLVPPLHSAQRLRLELKPVRAFSKAECSSPAAFVLNGTAVVCTNYDRKEIRIWSAKSLQQEKPIPIASKNIDSFLVADQGRLLLTSSPNRYKIWIWDVASRTLQQEIDAYVDDKSLDISPDGRFVVSSVDSGNTSLWDVKTGKSITLEPSSPWPRLAISPDGRWLAVTADKWNVKLWQLNPRRVSITLPREAPKKPLRHESSAFSAMKAIAIDSIVFSPDSRHLVVAYSDGVLRSWDLSTGRTSWEKKRGFFIADTRMAFHPGGRILAATEEEGVTVFWDIDAGVSLARKTGVFCSNRLLFSPDGRRLLLNGDGVTLFDVGLREE